jgi:hypothetical protein
MSDQKELLQRFQDQKTALKAHREAKVAAIQGIKQCEDYISKVRTEVVTIREQLKAEVKVLSDKCKAEVDSLAAKLAELPADAKKDRQVISKQQSAVKK